MFGRMKSTMFSVSHLLLVVGCLEGVRAELCDDVPPEVRKNCSESLHPGQYPTILLCVLRSPDVCTSTISFVHSGSGDYVQVVYEYGSSCGSLIPSVDITATSPALTPRRSLKKDVGLMALF